MTKQEIWQEFNDEAFDHLASLRERWGDEHEYECIDLYLRAIQEQHPNLNAYAITKRPFGIRCAADDGNIYVYLKAERNYLKAYGKSI